MRKSLLEIYALAVCFFTVACFAIALVIGLYDIIQITNPEFTLPGWDFERHQSDEAFKRLWPKEKPPPPPKELTELRQESYRIVLLNEQRNGMQSFAQMVIIILIDIVVFLGHWRLVAGARETADGLSNLPPVKT